MTIRPLALKIHPRSSLTYSEKIRQNNLYCKDLKNNFSHLLVWTLLYDTFLWTPLLSIQVIRLEHSKRIMHTIQTFQSPCYFARILI